MMIDDCRFGLSIEDSIAHWRLAITLPIAQSNPPSLIANPIFDHQAPIPIFTQPSAIGH
jgi:hypothetical protein